MVIFPRLKMVLRNTLYILSMLTTVLHTQQVTSKGHELKKVQYMTSHEKYLHTCTCTYILSLIHVHVHTCIFTLLLISTCKYMYLMFFLVAYTQFIIFQTKWLYHCSFLFYKLGM